MLTVWDPFNKFFEKSKRSYFDNIFENMLTSFDGIEQKVNDDGLLNITLDIPGIKESDLNVEISDGVINISGERKTATSVSSMRRSFSIPDGYDSDSVKAELKDGVLTLILASKYLPKTKETKETKKVVVSLPESK